MHEVFSFIQLQIKNQLVNKKAALCLYSMDVGQSYVLDKC